MTTSSPSARPPRSLSFMFGLVAFVSGALITGWFLQRDG
jgi:hypothetical protein